MVTFAGNVQLIGLWTEAREIEFEAASPHIGGSKWQREVAFQ